MDYGNAVAVRKEMRGIFSRVGWAMTLAVVMTYAVQFAIVIGIRLYAPQYESSEFVYWLLSTVPLHIFGLGTFALLTIGLPSVRAREQKELSALQIGFAACICMAMSGAGGLASNVFNAILGALKGSPVPNPMDGMTHMALLPNLLVVCILAPIVEEFLFRGLVINRLRPFGDAVCVFASAYFFALMHGNTWQMFSAFIIGGAYAYITVRTGTIVYSILLHMTNNVLATLTMQATQAENMLVASMLSLLVIIMTVTGIIALAVSAKSIHLDNRAMPGCGSAWRRLGDFLLTPGVIVYTVIHLILIVFVTFFT